MNRSATTFLCVLALLFAPAREGSAQVETFIYLDSTAQTIRGFGANNIVGWRPDMTDAEIETAFGTGDGQLGFSILRIRIPPDQNQWDVNLPTATRAHEMGVTLIASPWSPPADMKTNDNLVSGRLRDDMYDDYAAYLEEFNAYMSANGSPLYGLSVQNEPDVQVTYESCDWSPEQMTRFVREHGDVVSTRLIAPESFQFRRNMSDPILNDPDALENLDILGGHIYGGGLSPYPLAEAKGKEVWMTEHLVLDTDHNANIDTGVEIQRVMQAGMSAYIWWYIVRYYGPISDGEQGPYAKGAVTKRGYVMSQFSRFIRPGSVRVHESGPDPGSGVLVTAYRDSASVVVVAVNDASAEREVRVSFDGGTLGVGRRYVTSETQDAERLDDVQVANGALTAVLGPKSVTTFVLEASFSSGVGRPDLPSRSQLLQNYPNPLSRTTVIEYRLLRRENVRLEVFDLLGRSVAVLASGTMPAGTHRAELDAGHLRAGTYVYRLEAGEAVQTRRMTVVR